MSISRRIDPTRLVLFFPFAIALHLRNLSKISAAQRAERQIKVQWLIFNRRNEPLPDCRGTTNARAHTSELTTTFPLKHNEHSNKISKKDVNVKTNKTKQTNKQTKNNRNEIYCLIKCARSGCFFFPHHHQPLFIFLKLLLDARLRCLSAYEFTPSPRPFTLSSPRNVLLSVPLVFYPPSCSKYMYVLINAETAPLLASAAFPKGAHLTIRITQC